MGNAKLPVDYARRFSLHLYWVSHGILLLRSGKEAPDQKRIDILFRDVRWLGIPVFFDGLRIERCEAVDQPPVSGAQHDPDLFKMSQYRISSGGVSHYLVASPTVTLHEDDRSYHENSAMLPDFDFRSLADLDRT